ncbi:MULTISPECIES: NAD(P)-dependent oxidoreductase [Rubrivivax]|uniref:Phosphoglycerate dehydrogenase n=1 Tax=Rubrivivax benzoatilyticus TaxID=316997 RepID=A0ABX0HWY8_9BURK|nr:MULTISPECIES: NAD(P)-dependent oxidoreductase [Rubrivivax]EGJ10510.1 D-isomer specific 2-hydroxyacid dehydrogenase catalytic region [Rubrivivax benzoatilyticus JA2 = ATCC BAA-35]MCD0417731.1 phosphoglycerate dehydrogenase [Rubrivivax sp. JA1024]NHK99123.1 phosphoglycerate dehydrogenase [Rubrivivax benzoatilyticus]NHL25014.1 phosphoglycerate dehydrogenase [Rubrivivax benzoatilyticus]
MEVLIVEPLEQRALDWLGKRRAVHLDPSLASDPRRFEALLARARAVVVPPTMAMDARLLLSAPGLRAVGRLEGGPGTIDLITCESAGIAVVQPAGAGSVAEAEFATAAMLQLLRRVPVHEGHGVFVGRELSSSTVGIVGMSPTARLLSQLAGNFGARVVGYDPALHASDLAWRQAGIRPVPLVELLETCDVVVVLLAYYSRYHGLLGERLLESCKRDQVMVCLSPAALFDEAALAAALKSGRIAAAWFDRLEPGWLDPGRPLSEVDTLHVTPRLAPSTREARARGAWALVRRLDSLLGVADPQAAFSETVPDVLVGLAGGPAPA